MFADDSNITNIASTSSFDSGNAAEFSFDSTKGIYGGDTPRLEGKKEVLFPAAAECSNPTAGSSNNAVNGLEAIFDEAAGSAFTKDTSHQTCPNNNGDIITPVDKEIEDMMQKLNNDLVTALADHKKSTLRLLGEIAKFAATAQELHRQWEPLQKTVHAEASRLDELYKEVTKTTSHMILPLNQSGSGQVE